MDAEGWNERYGANELVWSAEPNRFVAEIITGLDPTPGSSLDVGCGEGRNAIWLASQGWVSRGVDFSEVAIDKARRLADSAGVEADFDVVDVVSGDLGGPYDLVLVAYLQLPAAPMAQALTRAAGAVAPGGLFLLVGHDVSNLASGYGGPPSPEVLSSTALVEAALDGFEILRSEVVERPVDTDGGPRVALDTLVVATRS